MSSGSIGTDENISGAKIQPLDSPTKVHQPHDFSGGVAGTEEDIDHSRIQPLGGAGHYRHPEPHSNSQGVVGRENVIASSKIDPMAHNKQAGDTHQGLDDESIDAARISPLGEVREEWA